jgi:putative peptidoglycan binding protein
VLTLNHRLCPTPRQNGKGTPRLGTSSTLGNIDGALTVGSSKRSNPKGALACDDLCLIVAACVVISSTLSAYDQERQRCEPLRIVHKRYLLLLCKYVEFILMTRNRWFVASFAVAVLFIAARPVQAAALTSAQISAIISLLRSFGADQSVVNTVSAELGGSSPSPSCITLSHDMTLGSTDATKGGEVSELQNYLIGQGDLPSGDNTGYYGFLTAKAVGRLQINLGLISSQTVPPYGIADAGTRQRLACGKISALVTPGATIDASSLHLTIPLVLMGTASGLNEVIITLYNYTPARAIVWEQVRAGAAVPVINGRWTYTVDVPDALSPGDKVVVTDRNGNQLAIGFFL